ncbi:MAG: phospho-N-acetylmuramoyl-pentapeptide-transferase [Fibrobacteres bacterium]|nr:phospho-N-acetylmuramoyl-pentapeptide-transferase [Fibrobacterota bacterium]
MIYSLLYPLSDIFSGFNVFRYITFRSAYAAITSLLIAFIVGPWIIRKLQAMQIRETIRTDGPQTHLKKSGTPTMGGIIVLTAAIVPTLIWARLDNPYIILVLVVTLWMGIIGFIDDYLKVIKKMKSGLIARYKMIGQITLGLVVGFALLYWPLANSPIATVTSVPFLKNASIDWGILFIPVVVFVITYTSNAVNLTDGLDGLAIGLSAIAFLAFAAIAYVSGNSKFASYFMVPFVEGSGELTVFCAAMVGACLGFLWFNANPASVFMGDVGSLPLGAALGAVALMTKKELLLISVAAIFIGEALSVIIQVTYFKWTKYRTGTGKRIFRMSPLHHHFELLGWPENKIVTRFWILGILFALLSLSTFKLR